MCLKTFTRKKAVIIRDVTTMHHPVISVEPSSYTYSVVDAPGPQNELKSNRASIADEINLRKPLLESKHSDGTAIL